tara:strand:- start:4376 stop:4576 length:201 start_codon:yes stop_codon:yes gene_type:complete
MSKKEEIKEEAGEKVEKVATGLGVLLSKALGSIPIIRGFQKAAIDAGGKNTSAEIAEKKPHHPHKH